MIPGIDYIKTVINGILSRITNISKKVDKNSDDIAVLKLDAASTKEEIKASTADWNQNDESAVDYIKNKPFHEETMEETILGEYTGELTGLKPSSNLVYGDKYVIYLDGVRYDVVCVYDSDANSILYAETEHGWIEVRDSCLEIKTNITGIHTLKVIHNIIDVYKIDSKFIDFPVVSVNGKTGFVRITASDIDAATTLQLDNKMNKYNPVGTGSFSMGRKSGTTIGRCSHAEGDSTTASGEYTHAEGSNTTAGGGASHAEGSRTKTSGGASHAEGSNTTAGGSASHAEGFSTTASGEYSHAEGFYTKTSGEYSHAEGYYTTAGGNASHAEGFYTTASGGIQHVQGRWNIIDAGLKHAHIVGNGTSDSARSNAHTLDWNGNAWFAGDVYTGSTSGTNKDDGSKKLATETYVDNAVTGVNAVPSATTEDNNKILSVVGGIPTWKEADSLSITSSDDGAGNVTITIA